MSDPDLAIYAELHGKLVNTLEQVRSAYDEGADDWEYQLLTTFQRFTAALGVERRLRAPLMRMQQDVGDRILRLRAQTQSSGGRPRAPSRDLLPLAAACAAVTVLKERGSKVADAAVAVSDTMGVAADRIRKQRDEINRGRASREMLDAYNHLVLTIRDWPTIDRLSAYRDL